MRTKSRRERGGGCAGGGDMGYVEEGSSLPPDSIPRRAARPLLSKQIADFAEQLYVLGDRRRRRQEVGGIKSFAGHLNHLDHQKDARGHDDEIDHVREERPVGEHWQASFLKCLQGDWLLNFSFRDFL